MINESTTAHVLINHEERKKREKTMPQNIWVPDEKDYRKAYELRAIAGNTMEDVYDGLGISRSTYHKWKKEFMEKFRYFDKLKSSHVKKNQAKRKREEDKRNEYIIGSRKLTPDLRKRILSLIEYDHTVEETAEICRISKASIYNWQNNIPAFRMEIKYARSIANMNVKKALKQRAVGMHVVDTVVTKVYDATGRLLSQINKVRNRELPGNVTAQQFYLINRDGWKKDSEVADDKDQGEILKAIDGMTKLQDRDIDDIKKDIDEEEEE